MKKKAFNIKAAPFCLAYDSSGRMTADTNRKIKESKKKG